MQVHKKGLVLQERGLPLQQLCVKLVDFGSAVHRLVCPTTMDVCCAGQCFLSRSRAVAWAGGMQKNWSLVAVVPLLFFALHRAVVCILDFPPPAYPSTSPHFCGVFFSFALLGHRGCRSWKHPTVVSTRHYRAPEIIMQLGWSYPADMWSMGCILVELVTGEVLFGMGQSQSDNTLAHLATMHQLLGPFPCAPVPSPVLYPTLEHATCLRARLSAFKVARALFCAGPPVSPVGIRVVLCSLHRAHQGSLALRGH